MQIRVLILFLVWTHLTVSRPLTQEEELQLPAEFALQELTKDQYDTICFLPDDTRRAHKIIRGLIEREGKGIKAALFRLTDAGITKALIEAFQSGVPVEVVVDPGALESGHYSKVFQLIKAGIPVYQYQTTGLLPLSKKESTYQTIMHHKTFIFENTVGGHSMVVFGSLNPTHAGFNGNEEVVAIRNAVSIVREFKAQFEKIKARSAILVSTDVPGKKKVGRPKKSSVMPGLARAMNQATRIARTILQ